MINKNWHDLKAKDQYRSDITKVQLIEIKTNLNNNFTFFHSLDTTAPTNIWNFTKNGLIQKTIKRTYIDDTRPQGMGPGQIDHEDNITESEIDAALQIEVLRDILEFIFGLPRDPNTNQMEKPNHVTFK